MDILDKYYLLRDYSGSPDDEYAQFIITLFMQLGEQLLPLLKESEKSKKKIRIKDSLPVEFLDEISLNSLTLA
ncbi:hypothetical protein [Apibacter mensalis]|uniref:hypothetical protein n=1 Tax=Apibacter mensalis TaxID=1586267 RepID=UPI0026E9DB5A|nr:hypothetical protein [Apibacter mensalis]